MELWDACDAQGRLTGGTLVRGQRVPDGIYHLVVGVLVEHEDGTLLLMQRDPHKETWPGVYEASAGGSVLSDETPEKAAQRELYEETGIRAQELIPLYEEISHRKHSLYRGYLCVTKGEKPTIRLQQGETVGHRWVTRQQLCAMMTESPESCVIQNGVRAYLGLADDGESDGFALLLP